MSAGEFCWCPTGARLPHNRPFRPLGISMLVVMLSALLLAIQRYFKGYMWVVLAAPAAQSSASMTTPLAVAQECLLLKCC
jgi:hypothetical protein